MLSEPFYIAASAATSAGGIYCYVMDDGVLKQTAFMHFKNANYLVFSADRRHIFASIADRNPETGSSSGGVASFKINPDKSLTFLSSQIADNMPMCHLAEDPKRHFLYSADYAHGTVAQYPLGDDGQIAPCCKLLRHSGSGPNKARQEGPHAHFTHITPDGRYLCVIDLGLDAIKAYPLNEDGIDETAVKTSPVLPPGAGPRHLTFTKDGTHAYLVTELGSTVISMNYSDGIFTPVQTLSMLPGPCKCIHWGAAIHLDEAEHFVLASNRGAFSTITSYRLLGGGLMATAECAFTGGASPRDFNFLPGGRKVAAGNEQSSNVYFFNYEPETGRLTPDGNVIENIPRPICFIC